MDDAELRPVLAALEGGEPAEAIVPLAYLAGLSLELDPGAVNAAARRAVLLLAAGGDPRRALDLDGRAVRALAGDLDSAERREALRDALDRLREVAHDLPGVRSALDELRADGELAWRAVAGGLLAATLGDDP